MEKDAQSESRLETFEKICEELREEKPKPNLSRKEYERERAVRYLRMRDRIDEEIRMTIARMKDQNRSWSTAAATSSNDGQEVVPTKTSVEKKDSEGEGK